MLLSIFIAFCLILNTVEIAFILYLSLLELKSKCDSRTIFCSLVWKKKETAEKIRAC